MVKNYNLKKLRVVGLGAQPGTSQASLTWYHCCLADASASDSGSARGLPASDSASDSARGLGPAGAMLGAAAGSVAQ